MLCAVVDPKLKVTDSKACAIVDALVDADPDRRRTPNAPTIMIGEPEAADMMKAVAAGGFDFRHDGRCGVILVQQKTRHRP